MNEKNNEIKSRIRHNIVPKIVCVLLAFILWLYVMDTENPDWERSVNGIGITLINTEDIEIDNGLTIYNGYDVTTDIVIRGRKNHIMNISEDDIKITVDVSGITKVGEYTLPVTVTLPDDAALVSQSVESVTVFVDKRDTMTLPVKTQYTSLVTDKDVYTLGEPVPSVTEIKVSGPTRYLDGIEYAQIMIPDLGRVTSSMMVYGKINLIDKNGGVVTSPYVTMTQTEVSVTIPVFKKKMIPLTVDYKYGYFNRDNSSVTMSPEYVYVKGDADLIDSLESISVMTIDEKKITESETKHISLNLPAGVENLDGVEYVDVDIKCIGVSTRKVTIQTSDLKVSNPNGVKYSVTDSFITFTLRGKSVDLKMLPISSVGALIDLSPYTGEQAGTFTIPVTVVIDSDMNVYELGDYSVEVEIERGDN